VRAVVQILVADALCSEVGLDYPVAFALGASDTSDGLVAI
jgi:hypothetical protein